MSITLAYLLGRVVATSGEEVAEIESHLTKLRETGDIALEKVHEIVTSEAGKLEAELDSLRDKLAGALNHIEELTDTVATLTAKLAAATATPQGAN